MTISIYGALRSDTTMTDNLATYGTVGGTFQINSYSQLTFEDGADPTVIAGDSITNETPNDPTQTMAGNAIAWDYTITVTDGTTNYEIGLVDYDLDGDGSFDWPGAEQGFFIAFIGSVPPLGTTLTIAAISNNGVSIPVDTVVPCFTKGTLIATPSGSIPIQDMQKGDQVLTLDHGAQTVRWIGSRKLNRIELARTPKLRPIRIAAGALGCGLPKRDLSVSPQHRMLLRSTIADRMFGETEVFLPAVKLVGLPGITVDSGARSVEYFHVLLDRHEVLFAEGAPAESLYTGPEAIKSVGPAAMLEIKALFPAIGTAAHTPVLARSVPKKGRFMKQLIARHLKNRKPLIAASYGKSDTRQSLQELVA
jgi:hypothetical protein